MKKRSGLVRGALTLALTAALALSVIGCSGGGKSVKLDPKKPVTISVWHYYNGAIMNAFEAMVKEFNETVGVEKGIVVEIFGYGNVGELEKSVLASANKEIGSMDMPNIFASYADTAYAAEKLELLANLGDYFTGEEQAQYLDSYIEEGRIGLGGELRIFPVAKSTEILILNETDWLPFAGEEGLTHDDLATMENVARVAAKYYDWTDARTPDIPNDGKAFFGRDAMANLFIIASKSFDTEIFKVEGGAAKINVNRDVMRKIWDYYYVPYISGHYLAYGRYRSDDAKVGDILAYVGSTSSAAYFPGEVTVGGKAYPVEAKVLPAPIFEGGKSVMVQQGAGMVVAKDTPQAEYASVLFLKWFTEAKQNIRFALMSGYMPVKKEAMDYDAMMSQLDDGGITLDNITEQTLGIVLEDITKSELYTNKAFDGGADAREALELNLQEKAAADREAVLKLLESGSSLDEAVSQYNTDDNFNAWLEGLTAELEAAAG